MGVRIVIIGAGFSGICLGITLKRAGIHSFTLLEKSGRVGGTWRDNRYPGCACDSPAFQYCFSFEQKTDWSRKWVNHTEIQRYLEHCVQKYDLAPHIRFDTEVADARFDADQGLWRVQTAAGERFVAEVLVSGVGQLNRPAVPDIPGLDQFAGRRFHTAQWDYRVPLDGARVGVIGNAASAIQCIPQIAGSVARLSIFQRSANWMLPRGDRAFSEAEHARFARFPIWARLYRWWQWWQHELRFPVYLRWPLLSRWLEGVAENHMRRIVEDPILQGALVPPYPIGGKRILISDDYYRTLNRPNVELISTPIKAIEPDGLLLDDGRRVPLDVLILATGFTTTEFLAPMRIVGRNAKTLEARWQAGAEAFLGITVSGFPNLFLMYGPNTNLGHNSIVFMIECQSHYILECIKEINRKRLKLIEIRRDVERAFNEGIAVRLARSAWAATGPSWYKNSDGRIINNWPGTTIEYWWRTRHVDLAHYEVESLPKAPRLAYRISAQS